MLLFNVGHGRVVERLVGKLYIRLCGQALEFLGGLDIFFLFQQLFGCLELRSELVDTDLFT